MEVRDAEEGKSSRDQQEALVSSLISSYQSGWQVGHLSKGPHRSPDRAVAWVRVSTRQQAAKGLSLPEQTRAIRHYAGARKIEIVREFQGIESAFRPHEGRGAFREMLDFLGNDSSVGLVLVHDFSRFSRNSLYARALTRELEGLGISVVSVTEAPFDRLTGGGVLAEAVTFAKNEAYSREISFHVRKGLRSNLQTRDPETGWCYKNGGPPLWGYRVVKVERGMRRGCPLRKSLWVPDDTEVNGRALHKWMRHCLVNMAAEGATLRELAAFCNQQGLPRARGGPWSAHVWAYTLSPSALLQYCGYGVWGVRRPDDGSLRPMSEWVIAERAHPPLISEKEAMVIAAVLKDRRARVSGAAYSVYSSPWLLSGGGLRCRACGRTMIGCSDSYVCSSRTQTQGRVLCPGAAYVSRPGLESLVEDSFRQLLTALQEICGQRSEKGGGRRLPDTRVSAECTGGTSRQEWHPQARQVFSELCISASMLRRCCRRAIRRLSRSMVERKREFLTWLSVAEVDPCSGEVSINWRLPIQLGPNADVVAAGTEIPAELSRLMKQTLVLAPELIKGRGLRKSLPVGQDRGRGR